MTRFPTLPILPATQTTAHFQINYPAPLTSDDGIPNTAPCGGSPVNLAENSIIDFHVRGDSIALTSDHPTATWLFRATLDRTASRNWTNLLPAIASNGSGKFCEQGITVPTTWIGFKGAIQVVQDAADELYFRVSGLSTRYSRMGF